MSYRFFVNPQEINWQEKKATISDHEHTYKISKVLRLRENDQVVLLDGQGLAYNAQIASFYLKAVQFRLLSRRSVGTESNLQITIAQAMLRGPKFDYVLQKATEIGVCEFFPIVTERTIIKVPGDDPSSDLDKKNDRYQKIVRDAAEQSERGVVPKVRDITTLSELCKLNLTSYDLKLVCLERAQANGIKEVLNSVQDKIQKVLVLIGPEGGFTQDESKLVLSSGFTSVSLGKRIFRSETASIVISSILFFYFSEMK